VQRQRRLHKELEINEHSSQRSLNDHLLLLVHARFGVVDHHGAGSDMVRMTDWCLITLSRYQTGSTVGRLFCKVIRVMRKPPQEMKEQAIWERMKSTFLIWCASSVMIFSKLNFQIGRSAIISACSSFLPVGTATETSEVRCFPFREGMIQEHCVPSFGLWI
jgi:hypothetical protein